MAVWPLSVIPLQEPVAFKNRWVVVWNSTKLGREVFYAAKLKWNKAVKFLVNKFLKGAWRVFICSLYRCWEHECCRCLFFFSFSFVLSLLPELFSCGCFSEGNATVVPLLGKITTFFFLELTLVEKTEDKLYHSQQC